MALSVKNMLGGSGGGASPFAWGKYTYEIAEKRDSAKNINITRTRTSGGSMNVYCSDSYTYDSDTGIFSLVSPTIVTAYCGSSGWNGLRGKYVIQTLDALNGGTTTSGKVLLLIDANATYTEVSAGVYSETNQQAMYGLNVSACTIVYYGANMDFIEYVTDKNPTKYPNGEVADDGFFYRYANEGVRVWEKYDIVDTFVDGFKDIEIPHAQASWLRIIHFKNEIHGIFSTNYATRNTHCKWVDGAWEEITTNVPLNLLTYACDDNYIYALQASPYDFHRFDGTSWEKIGVSPHGTENAYPLCVFKGDVYCLSRTTYKWNGTTWDDMNASNSYYTYYDGNAWADDNYIYVIRGGYNTVYKWDGLASSWTYTATNSPVASSYATVVKQGNVYYMTGRPYNYATLYKSTDGISWTALIPDTYNSIETSHGVAFDGESYIFGSYKMFGYHEDVYEYFDMIISDNENAYSDGGEQDGYYYKKASGGITPEMFGCTKMAIDTLVPTSDIVVNSSNYTVNHSLGEIPKVVLIVANQLPSLNTGFSFIYTRSDFANKWYGIYLCGKDYPATSNLILQSNVTESTFRIWMQYARYFVQGVEYSIITMA